MAEATPHPVMSIELALDGHSLLAERFSRDELVAILASDPALVAHFARAARPFIERQDVETARLAEEARLQAEWEESEARRDSPAAFAGQLLDQLLTLDDLDRVQAEETRERVEEGIRGLMAHIVDPSHGLDAENVLVRLARLDGAMRSYEVHFAWDYVGALSFAVEAQRDRLEPVERQRIASRFEKAFHSALDWETIWDGHLYETSYDDHKRSLKQDPFNTSSQLLRLPTRCKLPTERSSSLFQSLPFEIITQIIHYAADSFIPHPKTNPTRTATLNGLRADLLRNLARVGRAWRTIAQRELVKRPLVDRAFGLEALLDMLQRHKLGTLVRELHLDGGKVVRRDVPMPPADLTSSQRLQMLDQMESQADEEFQEALASKSASEKTLWTSLVRLSQTCPTLPSLRLSNLSDLSQVTHFIPSLQLHTLTLQSIDFPTTLIEIPSTIRNFSLLHVRFTHTDHLLDSLRHFTPGPSRLDTLILLDCDTPGAGGYHEGHSIVPNVSPYPNGRILETVTTLHLDATHTSAVFLQMEHLPCVTTIEFFTDDQYGLDFTAPPLHPPTPPKRHKSHMDLFDDEIFRHRQPQASERQAEQVLYETMGRLLTGGSARRSAGWRPTSADSSAVAVLVQRFTRDEVLAILTSDRALATHFLLASEPFAERQDQKEERRVEEVRLEAARVESNERRNSPERFVPVILNKLPGLDDEPIPVEDAERVHRRVEDAIRALMAHVVVPTSELDGASVLARLAKLDRAMNRTKGDGWRYPLVPITWDYVGALRLAVEAQRDRLEPLIERRRVASRLDGDFHAALDWEAIWHGYLHETTYDDHNQSLRQNPWNTHHQILRIPARCKLPSERSSSLLQSLPFELLSQIITASASDYIPHPKSSPDQAAALDTLRADRLRTLALIGPAWRNIAQRELIKRPLVGGVVGLGRFVSMLDKRKLGSLCNFSH
ncbi:hypothetical protein RQP46_005162 [Phenoliferia psychrophenolica]